MTSINIAYPATIERIDGDRYPQIRVYVEDIRDESGHTIGTRTRYFVERACVEARNEPDGTMRMLLETTENVNPISVVDSPMP